MQNYAANTLFPSKNRGTATVSRQLVILYSCRFTKFVPKAPYMCPKEVLTDIEIAWKSPQADPGIRSHEMVALTSAWGGNQEGSYCLHISGTMSKHHYRILFVNTMTFGSRAEILCWRGCMNRAESTNTKKAPNYEMAWDKGPDGHCRVWPEYASTSHAWWMAKGTKFPSLCL